MPQNPPPSFNKSLIDCARRASTAIPLAVITVLFFLLPQTVRAQSPCPAPPGGSSGEHTFQALGEVLTISFSMLPCHTVAVDISWANGLNNGSNLKVTFLDSAGQVIYFENDISAFLPGSRQIPLNPSYPYPWRGSRSALFNPASVRIETVYPFAPPCTINYSIGFASRADYNIGGDSFANAPLVTSLPIKYKGSAHTMESTRPLEGQSIPVSFSKCA